MSITKDALLDHIANMSVLELSELVKAFEEKFGVSAAPAMAMGMMPMMGGADAGAAAVVEEQTEFNVMLIDAGEKKINVIKVVRELTGLGLKEAKDLTEKGGAVKEGVDKATAEDAKKKLEEQGAKVELK